MKKQALYVEINPKVIKNSKRQAAGLGIPMTKLTELALIEFYNNNPQLELNFGDNSKSKKLK